MKSKGSRGEIIGGTVTLHYESGASVSPDYTAHGSKFNGKITKRGLDPNVWFQNVEYVAAEKVGQETVTYVSSIYKYYIAYRLVLESRAATKEAADKISGLFVTCS